MIQNYVILSNGDRVSLVNLFKQTPSSVYASETHDNVCNYLSNEIMKNKEELDIKLFTNLLLLKSKKARQLSALVYLINKKVINVNYISCSYVHSSFFDFFLNNKGIIKIKKHNFMETLIDKKYIFVIFPVKMILHLFYKALSKKIKYKKNIIKTYVEDTINFYPEELKTSTIMIYPFNLNFKRQQNFIKYCKKNYPGSYTRMGLPYRPIKYLYSLLTNFSLDEKIVFFEKDAYTRHAKELLNLSIDKLFTLDEFEAASFVMNENLLQNKVYVMNKTHGVGGYCLFLAYSDLEVYTSKQMQRYKKWNPKINISFQDLDINKLEGNTKTDKSIQIVFIHGNMSACGLEYEESLEEDIILQTKKICDDLKISFFIKYHPNTTELYKEKYLNQKIETLKSIDNLDNPLFITIFSTSFYDFLKFGPFIFVSDELLNPCDIFGDDIEYININMICKTINFYKDFNNFTALHNKQIEQLKDR